MKVIFPSLIQEKRERYLEVVENGRKIDLDNLSWCVCVNKEFVGDLTPVYIDFGFMFKARRTTTISCSVDNICSF